LIVASRRALRFEGFRTVIADLMDPDSLNHALSGVDIAICAAGPFQNLPTSLAEICIRRGVHYIDFADDRNFVRKVHSFAETVQSGSVICTGWSTVSALSGVLTQIAAEGMSSIDSIYIHMAPGNRGARHTATIASLMHSVGQPFAVFRDGAWRRVTGWSEPREFVFPPPIGARKGYLVDVPDHESFPGLFNSRTVEFRAGSELRLFNGCISLLLWTGRNWVAWSPFLQRAAALFSWFGHDWGAVGVEVSGSARRRVAVVADSSGERMAVMPASIMVGLLSHGAEYRGLVSPACWLTKDQLARECERRGFRLIVEEL